MGAGTRLLQRLLGRDDASGEPFLLEVRRGGGSFRHLVFTRNRRVMISVGSDRETLRLHEHFRTAPVEVQRAIGRLYARVNLRDRDRARQQIRDFLRHHPPAPSRPRKRRADPADEKHLVRLREHFEWVNQQHFGAVLPTVPLHLSGRMRRRNGHFSSDPLEIVVSRRLCVEAAEGEAERTLRHEMIHLWQHTRGERPDHGSEFRRWARILDIHPRATRSVEWLDCC